TSLGHPAGFSSRPAPGKRSWLWDLKLRQSGLALVNSRLGISFSSSARLRMRSCRSSAFSTSFQQFLGRHLPCHLGGGAIFSLVEHKKIALPCVAFRCLFSTIENAGSGV